MRYTDLIFDLYGTLVDIHTEENHLVWEKTALYFGYYGAHYTPAELESDFRQALSRRETKAGQSYECFPDIPFEDVIEELFRKKGITEDIHRLAVQAAQLFRIVSTDYIRLYPNVIPVLRRLREKGFRLWLLSNAQKIFTAYELRHLGLEEAFDGIFLSSDYGCRKPDRRFFQVLLDQAHLDPDSCLMIGNDRETDIAGATAAGLSTLYMHTELTPPDQAPADPAHYTEGSLPGQCHWEYEGSDWTELEALLEKL